MVAAQEWQAWKSIPDGAKNGVDISVKMDDNNNNRVLYYRFKNNYSKDICGTVLIQYILKDGTQREVPVQINLKSSEVKEAQYMNLYGVVKYLTTIPKYLSFCDGLSLNDSPTKGNQSTVFFAVCDDTLPLKSHGSSGWCGPKRTTYAEALQDVKSHNIEYEHQATVCSGNCPTCNN